MEQIRSLIANWTLAIFDRCQQIYTYYFTFRIFVDSDNEDDETKFVDDDDESEDIPSSCKLDDDDDEEEDELDKFMAGIQVRYLVQLAQLPLKNYELQVVY